MPTVANSPVDSPPLPSCTVSLSYGADPRGVVDAYCAGAFVPAAAPILPPFVSATDQDSRPCFCAPILRPLASLTAQRQLRSPCQPIAQQSLMPTAQAHCRWLRLPTVSLSNHCRQFLMLTGAILQCRAIYFRTLQTIARTASHVARACARSSLPWASRPACPC